VPLSGPAWIRQFPETTNLDDLSEPFRAGAKRFIGALTTAGATVTITTVYRPPERAYLMHWCWEIARHQVDPTAVPAMAGVEIQWAHPLAGQRGVDWIASRRAAAQMVNAYHMIHWAALKTRHTEGKAIDMNIAWEGDLPIAQSDGTRVTIRSQPRNGNGGNAELLVVAVSYGVHKLVGDRVHWSSDGH